MLFSSSLTVTLTLIFGYIKCTPYVSFTGTFLDIVYDQYFRQEMGKNCHHKCGMSLSSQVFAWQYLPGFHVRSVRYESLECEIMVCLG